MTEAWAWGQEFQLGYVKHPPMSAWIAGIWFALLPRLDWVFYLLASINAGIGLVGVWQLASLFVSVPGRWFAVLTLVLTPSYTLWALKFNANAPLISTWPWTAYFFLQSVGTQRIGYSVLTGAVGAMALLTKYSSLVLFATLLFVAATHPERRRYFTSSAPFVTLLTGLVLVAPHIWWLFKTGFPTLQYAAAKTHALPVDARQHTLVAAIASLGTLGLAALGTVVAFGKRGRPALRNIHAALADRSSAWLLALACGPLLLIMAGYFAANLRVTTGFLIPAFFAVPVVFLVLGRQQATRSVVRRLKICVAAVWVPLLMASPLLGYYHFATDEPILIEPRRQVAIEATKAWRHTMGRSLRYVSGSERVATAVSFYSPDGPSYVSLESPEASLWATPADLLREGILVICRAGDASCIKQATLFSTKNTIRYADSFASSYLGQISKPQQYVLFLQPPAGVTVVWD